MRNFIKYSPLEWRKSKGQCIPQGPSFRSAKEVAIRFPQCSLTLRLPRHAPQPGIDSGEWRISSRVYGLDERDHDEKVMPSQSWKYEQIGAREWAFYGPWFTGCRAYINFYAQGLSLSEPNARINFLHPKALEAGALGYMTAYWGHEIYTVDRPHYRGPLNWTPLRHLPVPALRFDMVQNMLAGSRHRYVFFPVARDRLISLSFTCYQRGTGTQEELDARISPQPMLDLVEKIIGSLRLSLSPELQRELDQVSEQCPDMAVSADCPPLDWPAHVERDGLTIVPYDERLYAEAGRE